MDFFVDLEFISGDRTTKSIVALNKTQVIDRLSGGNWFQFDDDEFINMNNVKSFKVVSKQEREEDEARQAKVISDAINNWEF